MTDVQRNQRLKSRISDAARAVVDGAGSGPAALVSLTLVLVWAVIGLLAGFSEDWLALLFACSGAVTLVMVFFIQHVTARDLRAVLLKLDELVAATEGARDQVMRAERLPLHEQEELEAGLDDHVAGEKGGEGT